MTTKAIVVFSGQTDFWWQWFLKPGFRHCGILIEVGGHWVVLEPLAARLEVRLIASTTPAALMRMLRRRCLSPVLTEVDANVKPSSFTGLFTCVEAVKRVLGIRAVLVQTPWQLKKTLGNRKKNLEPLTR